MKNKVLNLQEFHVGLSQQQNHLKNLKFYAQEKILGIVINIKY